MSDENASQGGMIIRTIAAMLTLSGLFVAARLYTRLIILKRGDIDDLLVGIAWILNCVSGSLACAQVRLGFGRHQNTVPPENLVKILKSVFVGIMVYNISLCLSKIAVLVLYLRIIVNRRMRLIVYGMIVVIALYGVETLFTGIFTCSPIRHFWDFTVPGTCVDKGNLWITNAAINVATDFIIFLLPLPVIFRMMMSLRQKILLTLVFSIGLCVCVISLFRLKTLTAAGRSTDFTWDGVEGGLWSSAELSTAILCTCFSTVRPLLSRIAPKVFMSTGTRRTGDGQNIQTPAKTSSGKGTFERATTSENKDQHSVDISYVDLQGSSVPTDRSNDKDMV